MNTGLKHIFIYVFLFSSALFGQSAVRGKLEFSEDSLPAADIVVSLLHSEKERSAPALSGPDGMFYLYNVAVGEYTLEVWNKGLKQDSLAYKISVTPANLNAFVDVPIIRFKKPAPAPELKK